MEPNKYGVCDRCKKEFQRVIGMAAFFNAFPEQDGPWLIDLCPECKKKLYRWIYGDNLILYNKKQGGKQK